MSLKSYARFISVVTVAFLSLLGIADAGYKDSVNAAKTGDFVTALREFKELSKQAHSGS
jgi:hypothetical protein